jgi:hypothetical protein
MNASLAHDERVTSSVNIKSKMVYRDKLEGCAVLSAIDCARFFRDFVE